MIRFLTAVSKWSSVEVLRFFSATNGKYIVRNTLRLNQSWDVASGVLRLESCSAN